MKCNECNMENIDGALFCEECGAKLDAVEPLQDTAVERPDSREIVLATSDGGTLSLPARDEIIIGREDPVSEIFPDIDLTGLGGMEKGVSRRHAKIVRMAGGLAVEDLGSTNGTYVNKKKVQPNSPQDIKPGDELRFGKLTFTVQAA